MVKNFFACVSLVIDREMIKYTETRKGGEEKRRKIGWCFPTKGRGRFVDL